MLTCIGTIAMFYNMCFLCTAKSIGIVADYPSLQTIMLLGTVVVGIFSCIFLFYTNSFLIKQRKREFGLFNILGMEKRHIARIMCCETLFIGFFSLVAGILSGILFSKLVVLLLLKLISFEAVFGFEIPLLALILTVALFSIIFAMILVYNAIQVYRSKPVELLKSARAGEKEPKTKWILTVVGVISLGLGYYIALATESPLKALNVFFIAVLLVIIGTYCLFTSGSIAVLKMLRKNKRYYYRANHFTSVSGMVYRMKRNATGLANICILSTMVIVMLSTTISLYVGIEDVLRTRFPRNIVIHTKEISNEQVDSLNALIAEQIRNAGVSQENVVFYRYMDYLADQEGNFFTGSSEKTYSITGTAYITFMTQEDYNIKNNASISLGDRELLLYAHSGEIPGNIISFNGLEFTIKDRLENFDAEDEVADIIEKSYYVIVKDIESITQIHNALAEEEKTKVLSLCYGFDTDAGRDVQVKLVNTLQKELNNSGFNSSVEGAENSRASFLSLYGGLFFLGIFLGLLFIMATVLIIYYKQIAEGYDDRERFIIMQKVGMSHEEVKKSIHSQVLTVFFLPIGAAVVHLAFAFKVITKLLIIFNLSNIPLYAGCTVLTILVFALLYAIVYSLTARAYYRIVSSNGNQPSVPALS